MISEISLAREALRLLPLKDFISVYDTGTRILLDLRYLIPESDFTHHPITQLILYKLRFMSASTPDDTYSRAQLLVERKAEVYAGSTTDRDNDAAFSGNQGPNSRGETPLPANFARAIAARKRLRR